MDVDLLSKMIRELILDSDEVSLPKIGTFVTEIVPASFSDKGYTINPPYRRLFFRERTDEKDDALVRLYASSNGVSEAQAGKIVTDFLTEMMGVLREKKTVVLPGLGRLRATRENNIFFIADEDLDIWPAGFALERVSLKTHEETEEEVGAAVSSLKSILDEPAEKPKSEEKEEVAEETEEKFEVSETETEEKEEVAEDEEEASKNEEATDITEESAAEAKERVEAIEVEVETTADAKDEEEEDNETAEEPMQETERSEEAGAATEPEVIGTPEEQSQEQEPKSAANGMKKMRKALLWTVAILAVLLAAYIIAGRMGLLDKALYTPEELELLYNSHL